MVLGQFVPALQRRFNYTERWCKQEGLFCDVVMKNWSVKLEMSVVCVLSPVESRFTPGLFPAVQRLFQGTCLHMGFLFVGSCLNSLFLEGSGILDQYHLKDFILI